LWKNSRLERTALATADRETTDREPEAPRSPVSPALPNARLNPLLNPLLAKQLGRWAHIYYTASVDKREAAIEKLVCELEAEEARLGDGVNTAREHETSSPQGPLPPRIPGPVLAEVEVMEVAAQGAPVVEIPRAMNFPSKAPVEQQPTFEQAVQIEQHAQRELEAPLRAVRETVPGSWQELLRRAGSAPQEDQWQASQVREADVIADQRSDEGSYIPRDAISYSKSLDDLLAKSEPIQMLPPSGQKWRLPMIVAVVLAALGGSLWMIQGHLFQPGAVEQARRPLTPDQPSAVQPPVAQPSGASPSFAAPASASAHSTPASTDPQPISVANDKPKPPNVNGAKSNASAQGPSLQAAPPTDADLPSDPELLAGMRELQGPQRNSTEAARHLWQSVKNQNGSALIPLAGLYAKGDGVTKDCDQAKILLDAATRQAKSHAQFLRVEMSRADLRTSGCE